MSPHSSYGRTIPSQPDSCHSRPLLCRWIRQAHPSPEWSTYRIATKATTTITTTTPPRSLHKRHPSASWLSPILPSAPSSSASSHHPSYFSREVRVRLSYVIFTVFSSCVLETLARVARSLGGREPSCAPPLKLQVHHRSCPSYLRHLNLLPMPAWHLSDDLGPLCLSHKTHASRVLGSPVTARE